MAMAPEYPICLQATCPSVIPNVASHTGCSPVEALATSRRPCPPLPNRRATPPWGIRSVKVAGGGGGGGEEEEEEEARM